MFAILIASTNLSKIYESPNITENFYNYAVKTYLAQPSNWYLITGYVDRRGRVEKFAVLPQYILDKDYQYDPVKIQTDWDQIVRK